MLIAWYFWKSGQLFRSVSRGLKCLIMPHLKSEPRYTAMRLLFRNMSHNTHVLCKDERGTLPATIRLGTETSISSTITHSTPLPIKLYILASIMKEEKPFYRCCSTLSNTVHYIMQRQNNGNLKLQENKSHDVHITVTHPNLLTGRK